MEKLGVDIKKVIDLRQKLHKFPELSGNEDSTIKILKNFFSSLHPAQTYELGHSIAFVFGDINSKKTIVFRCDIDALPIEESLDLPYASVNDGISHKCGHDGHTAILAGLAQVLVKKPLKNKVVLLFQSAEETLSGAVEVLSSPQFKQIEPSVIVGFHNIPGYEQSSVIVRKEEFNAYVTGIKITLKGQSAHAAYSQANIDLLLAVDKIIAMVENWKDSHKSTDAEINLTYLNYGRPTFEVSPDTAVIHLVLRSFSNDTLEKAMEQVEAEILQYAKAISLEAKITYTEDAPAIYNDPSLSELLMQTAAEEGYPINYRPEPFPWGEDFGFYTIRFPGIYFGIGAGKDTPQLHSREYDFPDEIILPSIKFLYKFYLKLSQKI